MHSKISIILTSYGQAQLTWNCINSFSGSYACDFNIIIIDNANRPEDCGFIKNRCEEKNISFQIITNGTPNLKFDHGVYWHTAPQNLGYAGGMNLGAKIAGTEDPDFLLILNNDTTVPKNFLLDFLAETSNVSTKDNFGFSGCLIRTMEDGKIDFSGGKLNLSRCMGEHLRDVSNLEVHETEFLTGCCLLCRPAVYKKLGGMDERFFLYFEDFDLSYRAIRAGYKLYITPKVELLHCTSSSTGGDEKPLAVFYSTRNRLWFMRSNFNGFMLLRFYSLFFSSRFLKAIKWGMTGKLQLIKALLKGLIKGLKNES